MKKILWKSEFRFFTFVFGCFALVLAVFAAMHAIHHEWGETFGTSIAVLLPLIPMLILAFSDSDGIKRSLRPEVVEQAKQEALKDSFLNWKNIPPNKRNPPPGTIG